MASPPLRAQTPTSEDDGETIQRLLAQARGAENFHWGMIEEAADLVDQRPALLVDYDTGWDLILYRHAYEYYNQLLARCYEAESLDAVKDDWGLFVRDGLPNFLRKTGLLQSGRLLSTFKDYPALHDYLPVITLVVFASVFLANNLTMTRQDIRTLEGRSIPAFSQLKRTIEGHNESRGTSHTLDSFLVQIQPTRQALGRFNHIEDYKWHLTRTFNDFVMEGLETGLLSSDNAGDAADIFLRGLEVAKTQNDCIAVLQLLVDKWPRLFSDFLEREQLRRDLPGHAFVLGSKNEDPLIWAGLYARYR